MICALVLGRHLPGIGENVTVVESGVGRGIRRDRLGGDSTMLSSRTIRGACWMVAPYQVCCCVLFVDLSVLS